MFVTAVPRKLICVDGLALSLSGAGETVTDVPASSESRPTWLGMQLGEMPLGDIAPEMLPVANRIATVTGATGAIASATFRRVLMRAPCGGCAASRDRACPHGPGAPERAHEQLHGDGREQRERECKTGSRGDHENRDEQRE